MKGLLVHVAIALGVLAAGTWLALEWSDVAVLATHGPDGGLRRTSVWFVESDGEIWLEAGAPDNPWLVDLQSDPRVSVDEERIGGEYTAEIVPDRAAARRVRELIHEKYGRRDSWVGIFVDSAASTAVRLHPLPERLRQGGSPRIQETFPPATNGG